MKRTLRTFLLNYCLGVKAFTHLQFRPQPHAEFFRCNKHGEVEVLQGDVREKNRLAGEGFRVAYVTNHVLSFSELQQLATREEMCSSLPVLRVESGLLEHERVSFTLKSENFALHTEKELAERGALELALHGIEKTLLIDDLARIF